MDNRELTEPILLELLKHAVDAIVDEMAIALVRTAYSNNLKNSMDMSCALCDAQGRLIAQGMTLPLHLGSIPDAMGCITRKFSTSVRPGDVFILNDPYEAGRICPISTSSSRFGLRTRWLAGRRRSAISSMLAA
jgi:N-methylhydantoinase B